MNIKIKHLPALGVIALAAAAMGTSCTDKLAFGDAFLEKAPGGTVTADTVFSNAEYTRYFLAQLYAFQYYNLPTGSSNEKPQWYNYWKGMPDLLADTHHTTFTGHLVFSSYYNGTLQTANYEGNYNIHPYTNSRIWENVRGSYILMDNVDRVPGLDDQEKLRMKDEAKCLLVYTYFTAFRHYGALPIVTFAYNGNESEYSGRASASDCVDFMVNMLDEVIAAKNLPWKYEGDSMLANAGHWTLGGAMGLKIQILQFAASPLLNAAQPYYGTKYSPEHPEFTWFGGYDATRWTKLRQACEEFMQANGGKYHLVQPIPDEETGELTAESYAFAFRDGYEAQESPEVVHSIRIATNAHANDYVWYNLGWAGQRANPRCNPSPTQEYVEMFPWADGTPFDWDKAQAENKLDEMFVKGEIVKGYHMLQNLQYTRDPRLYETVGCNNVPSGTQQGNAKRQGQPFEAYVGGTSALQDPVNCSESWPTGYRNLKYIIGDAMDRTHPQWNPIMYNDILLTYAEAILQSGGSLSEAVKYVDQVRARVGMKGLVECNPDKNLLSDKDALLEEILRERACELALQQARYFDLIRYKRADVFEKPLHGLRMYRMVDGKRDETKWYDGDMADSKIKEDNPRFYQPDHFEYEKFVLSTGARIWWTQGFDPKWYFQPLPITEVLKGYGLEQNPGW